MTILIILILSFGILAYTYVAPISKARKRLKRFEKAKKQSLKAQNTERFNENQRKTGLNIPGYYEDVVNKDKLKQTYKWNLYDSI